MIVKSLDVDECAQGISGCSQGCRNTNRSFICTCNEGYQTHHNDPTFCVGLLITLHVWFTMSCALD